VPQHIKSFLLASIAVIGIALSTVPVARSITPEVPALVTQPIDDAITVELAGNVRPEAIAANDRGAVDDARVLDHIQLLLNRPAETEAALVRVIDELHDPKSPQFHAWLTVDQFTARYGPAASDLQAITAWLSGHGFIINGVHGGNLFIDITGTAAQVRDTFHTEIHVLDVGGVSHIANMTDPRIPAALADAVIGIVSLHDFRPHTNFKPKYTFNIPGNGVFEAVVPGDLATIYNLNPLFAAGISGQGQTVVVIEDADVYSAKDITSFRKKFGLSSYTSGSFSQEHPAPRSGKSNCSDPGIVPGAESEATLDAEWAGAAAPSAAIVAASCADTAVTFGGLIALQNLIDGSKPPAIVSISYGECEAENGETANAAYVKTYQQAVALGTSVFVSSGDEGAVSCDADQYNAVHGIGVSGFASTPYNVAVGGTDFGDSYANDNSKYWSTKNSSTYESARSYIPEIPWDDSCANSLVFKNLGFTSGYGSNGACNSQSGEDYLGTTSGSGGPSQCSGGKPSIPGVVSGTCKGTPKPSWQVVDGNPADGVRDIPDVSLFAANGIWGHFYVYCDSDVPDGGSACTGSPSTWSGAGGTSFSSPILAGVQALVNQKTGSIQGNPNTVYYALAASEYGASGDKPCNSSNGNAVAKTCIFYDVTEGDIDVNCTGTHDCYLPSGTFGVISTKDSIYNKGYGTTGGWDFATGIGTVNITNLVNAWPR